MRTWVGKGMGGSESSILAALGQMSGQETPAIATCRAPKNIYVRPLLLENNWNHYDRLDWLKSLRVFPPFSSSLLKYLRMH